MDHAIKQLVVHLTGFQDGSENFRRTFQFVQSNFRFHRYLDPDSHKITRNLQGIQEKLIIHSEPGKAAALQNCVETFLNSPISARSEHPKTEAHYAVLSLLLNLSNSPINAVIKERKPEEKAAAEPEFDWTRHLLEGLEPIRSFRETSEEEWSDDEEEEDDMGRHDPDHRPSRPGDLPLSPYPSIGGGARDLYGASWAELSDSVVTQYWREEQEVTLLSNHISHQVTRHWAERERANKPFLSDESWIAMTETQIIRESIWVLMGAGKSFVYQLEGGKYVARGDIQLSHLTPTALHCITKQLAELGSKVSQLQAFIDGVRKEPMKYCQGQRSNPLRRQTSVSSEKDVASPKGSGDEPRAQVARPPSVTDLRLIPERTASSSTLPDVVKDVSPADAEKRDPRKPWVETTTQQQQQGWEAGEEASYSCQTYETFAEALVHVLDEFRGCLLEEERKVVAQEETYTLAMFKDWLESMWLGRLTLLHTLYQQGIEDVAAELPSHRVYFLLNILQDAVKEHYCLGFDGDGQLDLLWHLWIETTRPYITFITRWLTSGTLCDPADEFAIHRNQDIHIKSESYWKKAFSLQSLPTEETDGAALSLFTNQEAEKQFAPQRRRGVSSSAVPEFLQPVLHHVLLAGKSMEILEATGKLSRMEQAPVKDVFESLRGKFSRHKLSDQPSRSVNWQRPSVNWQQSSPPVDVAELVQRQLSQRAFNDPLIARGICEVCPGPLPGTDDASKRSGEKNNDSREGGIRTPLELVLYRQLYPGILARCQAICTQLADVLKKDFNLQGHLLSLRRFFLLEAGDVMYDFYSTLFDKVRVHEAWQDSLNLNYHLQETLSTRFPDEAPRISVSIEPHRVTGKMATQPIHALDILTLHYKVPWPVDIVIHHNAYDIYNQVFRFLLQVKRAQYCLQQLRFPDLTRSAHRGGRDDDSDSDDIASSMMRSSLHRSEAKEALKDKLPLIHRLFLLRFRLLHFVNAVHNYLMTRILCSTGREFSAAIDKAANLDQILAAHRSYLGKVSERCLLHHKVSFVKEAVTKVLNLALTFQRRWDAGVHTFNNENMAKAEDEFYNCNVFLSTLLANIIRRGTFPHLEALALSLSGPRDIIKSGDSGAAMDSIR